MGGCSTGVRDKKKERSESGYNVGPLILKGERNVGIDAFNIGLCTKTVVFAEGCRVSSENQ